MNTRFQLAAAAATLLLALPATACLTPDQLAAMQKDISDTRAAMEAMRKQNEATATSLETLKASLAQGETGTREASAEMNRQAQAIRDDIRIVNSRLDELQHRLSGLSLSASPAGASRPAPAPIVPVPLSGEPADTSPGRAAGGSADDLFNGAYADYSKGNYAPAILGFEDFLRRNPTSDKADDALYWIGLCHYDQGEYLEAIAQFNHVIQDYPAGDKVPAAQLKKGLSLLEMNRTAQGVVQLQALIEHSPRSEEARIAKDRLKEIGVKP